MSSAPRQRVDEPAADEPAADAPAPEGVGDGLGRSWRFGGVSSSRDATVITNPCFLISLSAKCALVRPSSLSCSANDIRLRILSMGAVTAQLLAARCQGKGETMAIFFSAACSDTLMPRSASCEISVKITFDVSSTRDCTAPEPASW